MYARQNYIGASSRGAPDIDFRFQFNAVAISQARSFNTNFVLSDFSWRAAEDSSASRGSGTTPRRRRRTRRVATREASPLRAHHEYSLSLTTSTFLFVSQCRRARSWSSTETRTDRARRSGRTWRATTYGSTATFVAVSIVNRNAHGVTTAKSFLPSKKQNCMNFSIPQCGFCSRALRSIDEEWDRRALWLRLVVFFFFFV